MKLRWFIIVSLGLAAIGLVILYSNMRLSSSLRDQIVAEDVHGTDITLTKQQLTDLTTKHMGTSQTILLTTSYNRAVATARANAAGSDANGQVYSHAQAACSGKIDSVTQATCVSNYVASHTTPGTGPQPVVLPKTADFTLAFHAPAWTPDLAGFLMLAGALVVVSGLGWSLSQHRH